MAHVIVPEYQCCEWKNSGGTCQGGQRELSAKKGGNTGLYKFRPFRKGGAFFDLCFSQSV